MVIHHEQRSTGGMSEGIAKAVAGNITTGTADFRGEWRVVVMVVGSCATIDMESLQGGRSQGVKWLRLFDNHGVRAG